MYNQPAVGFHAEAALKRPGVASDVTLARLQALIGAMMTLAVAPLCFPAAAAAHFYAPMARLATARAAPAFMNFLDDFVEDTGGTHASPIDAGMRKPLEDGIPLGPGDVVDAVCRSLQDNGRGGANNEGFARLYESMTPQGRTYVAPPPPHNGRLDGVSLDYFIENGCDPVFALVGCDYYTIIETAEVPATETRGGLGTVKVRVDSSLKSWLNSQRCSRSDGSVTVGKAAATRVPLGTGDRALQKLIDDADDDDDDVPAVPAGDFEAQEPMSGLSASRERAPQREQQSRTLLFGMEQQRRPPLAGVWLIKEVLPLEQTLFQVINKGSTEDW